MSDVPEKRGMGRYEVPVGIEIATAWAWRLIVLGVAGLALVWFMRFFSTVTVPIAVALLGAALTVAGVDWLHRHGIPRAIGALAIVLALLGGLAGVVYLVTDQLSTQFASMRQSVVDGIGEMQDWAKNGPLNLTDRQLSEWIDKITATIAESDREVITQATEFGSLVSHFVAGFFIALFALYFFLYEGEKIWRWVLEFFPQAARAKVSSSGHAAWATLTAFVRATVLVALVDAIGIALVAVILDVPLALAIGVIVFLGAFVPIVGALASGMVAVLVALVDQGPVTALLMLAGVVAVQQIESHVLQPFLMGHLVAVHPLAIILAITAGIATAGIVGALIAVPFAACANSIVRHLAGESAPPPTDGLLGSDSKDLRSL